MDVRVPTRVPSAWYRFGFYLRFALAGWASLAAFPLLAVLVAPDLLGGLLVLTPVQCGVLGFVVGLALESFGSMVRFIAAYAHRQFDLVYADRDSYRGVELSNDAPKWLRRRVAIRAAQLGPAIVLFGAVVFATGQDVDNDSRAIVRIVTLVSCLAGFYGAQLLLHPVLTAKTTRHVTDAVYRMTRRARVAAEDVLEQQAFARRQAKLVFAFWTGLYLALQFVPPDSAVVSSLTLVVVVLTWLAWLLAAAAFFLDRWLLPLALAVLIALATVPELGQNDHFFRVAEDPKPQDHRLPWDIVCPDGRPMVVVAASGGGIQASVWTARVLRHLTDDVAGFRERVRLISSVSGGSVGTMFYLNDEVRRAEGPHSATPTAIQNAERSALDAIAFGIAFRDLWRPFFSWIGSTAIQDRGYFLERSWARDCPVCDWPISRLRDKRRQYQLPDFVFNGTVVESGSPAYLGTVFVPSTNPVSDHLSGWDLSLVTAARLSATFPWVSPAARPITIDDVPPVIKDKAITYHIVDGGYYDNYGVSTLVNVLEDGLSWRQNKAWPLPSRIIVINVEASTVVETPTDARTSFRWQSLVPMKALLSVRDTAQRTQGMEEIRRLAERWKYDGVIIRQVPAIFPLSTVPLSWRLTQKQIGAFNADSAVQTLRNLSATVRDYLAEGDATFDGKSCLPPA